MINNDESENIEVLRHSTSHVMAAAILEIFPEAKFGIGPAIENGFYYDFELPRSLTPNDLPKIEKKMKKIASQNLDFIKNEVPVSEAIEIVTESKQNYKSELIDELKEKGEKSVTFYKTGNFSDLCAGPHVPSTKYIKNFKLTKIAGAYWRGDVKKPMLQRIYGIAFKTKDELESYLKRLEEAEKRDHRMLGKHLDLFSFHDEAPGFPFFHPKGMTIINEILNYWREVHEKAGYLETRTPILLQTELWKRSGHWDNYRKNMYFTKIDNLDVAIKPMNCPGGLLIYNTKTRSYRDLPLKMAELGLVHRHELSGVLHGLFRVRSFTQDDAHIFCTPEQIQKEVVKVINLTTSMYKGFGFEDWEIELSTKPEKHIGTDEMWQNAENSLKKALAELNINYRLNPGDGAFYGPKIDFHIKDCMERKWQCATIQLDFAMPERFDLEYMGADNQRHRPVMIHRAILGSIERFLGVLIEHYGGVLPGWLSPVQAIVIPIADRHIEYAEKVLSSLRSVNLRATSDYRKEQVSYKIRDAQIHKIPFMLVAGDKEQENDTISVRSATTDLGAMKFKDALHHISSHCKRPN